MRLIGSALFDFLTSPSTVSYSLFFSNAELKETIAADYVLYLCTYCVSLSLFRALLVDYFFIVVVGGGEECHYSSRCANNKITRKKTCRFIHPYNLRLGIIMFVVFKYSTIKQYVAVIKRQNGLHRAPDLQVDSLVIIEGFFFFFPYYSVLLWSDRPQSKV